MLAKEFKQVQTDIKDILESDELIRMCYSYFDRESAEEGVDELSEKLTEYIKQHGLKVSRRSQLKAR